MINEFKQQVRIIVVEDSIEKLENQIDQFVGAIEQLESAVEYTEVIIKMLECELEELEDVEVEVLPIMSLAELFSVNPTESIEVDCNGCIHADGMPQNKYPCCFCLGDQKETEEYEHDCDTCMYRDFDAYETPCRQCTEDEDNWELAEEE